MATILEEMFWISFKTQRQLTEYICKDPVINKVANPCQRCEDWEHDTKILQNQENNIIKSLSNRKLMWIFKRHDSDLF